MESWEAEDAEGILGVNRKDKKNGTTLKNPWALHGRGQTPSLDSGPEPIRILREQKTTSPSLSGSV